CQARWVMLGFRRPPRGCVRGLRALQRARTLRGRGNAARMMAAQLMGPGGIACLLLLGAVTGVPAATDVALTLALLATFASIAFVKKWTPGPGADGPGPTGGA